VNLASRIAILFCCKLTHEGFNGLDVFFIARFTFFAVLARLTLL
jgi:hypothetical protein